MSKRRNSEDHPYRDAPHVRSEVSRPVPEEHKFQTSDRDYTVAQVHEIHDQLERLFLQRDDLVQTLNSPDQEEMDRHLTEQSIADSKKKTKGNEDPISMIIKEKATYQRKLRSANEKIENLTEKVKGLEKICNTLHTKLLHERQLRLIAVSTFNNKSTDAAGKEAIVSSASQGQTSDEVKIEKVL
ncbi:hypothetical protein NW762_008846 [Fusarium torreyae]|uniref:Uncharacterized protein n=1 Tax=Fusarium torreyae TaxID=1237075 RepID=A0A9W8RUN9_9HYPO|nr:hypothetical protein NW762_008846 [Fusarium torreyae]